MTNLDGHRQFALGATVREHGGAVEPVGIARFARLEDTPTVAEVAILVIDAFQGQGVGRTLLGRLAAAALARGILRFRGIVLPENRPIIRLLTRYAPDPAILQSGEHLRIDVDLASSTARRRGVIAGIFAPPRAACAREPLRPSARRARAATDVARADAHLGGPFNSTVLPSGSVM